MRFDAQAPDFDARAGLGAGVAEAVASAVCELAAQAPPGALLEIGAGTGELGARLTQLPRPYLGFDRSRPMLARFQNRLWERPPAPNAPAPLLVLADGQCAWPLGRRSTAVIFSSRAIHLLDPEHTASELVRTGVSGAVVLLGHVQRAPDSARTQVRRRMRALLRERGLECRGGRTQREALLVACCAHGARVLDSRTVCRWQVRHAPAASLRAWSAKPGLAGIDLPGPIKSAVLAGLEKWMAAAFLDPDAPIASEESYVLENVILP